MQWHSYLYRRNNNAWRRKMQETANGCSCFQSTESNFSQDENDFTRVHRLLDCALVGTAAALVGAMERTIQCRKNPRKRGQSRPCPCFRCRCIGVWVGSRCGQNQHREKVWLFQGSLPAQNQQGRLGIAYERPRYFYLRCHLLPGSDLPHSRAGPNLSGTIYLPDRPSQVAGSRAEKKLLERQEPLPIRLQPIAAQRSDLRFVPGLCAQSGGP
mmetsp:Transcript_25107/g.59255  ORF Transcript_25107/g.59255 Transcript_25107/m.59255 type:complete len:213 (+) Transcript_25107:114-752(+)